MEGLGACVGKCIGDLCGVDRDVLVRLKKGYLGGDFFLGQGVLEYGVDCVSEGPQLSWPSGPSFLKVGDYQGKAGLVWRGRWSWWLDLSELGTDESPTMVQHRLQLGFER